MLAGTDRFSPATRQQLVLRRRKKEGRTDSARSLPDNRKQAARFIYLQSIILEGSDRQLQREFSRKRLWQLQAAESWLEKSAILRAESWPVMEVSDYLKRHSLKIKSKRTVNGTTVLNLSDNSAIFTVDNMLWRHESASRQAVFYDFTHAQNPDAIKTHFWTKAGTADNKT